MVLTHKRVLLGVWQAEVAESEARLSLAHEELQEEKAGHRHDVEALQRQLLDERLRNNCNQAPVLTRPALSVILEVFGTRQSCDLQKL